VLHIKTRLYNICQGTVNVINGKFFSGLKKIEKVINSNKTG